MPSRMREAATLTAQKSRPRASSGKAAERDGYGESRDGVAGGKRELVGRQQGSPAVRFEGARAAAGGGFLEAQEQRDAKRGGHSGGGYSQETLWAAHQENDRAHGVPEPAIAAAGGAEHPGADPAGRLPAIDAPHEGVVAVGDVFEHGAGVDHTLLYPKPGYNSVTSPKNIRYGNCFL